MPVPSRATTRVWLQGWRCLAQRASLPGELGSPQRRWRACRRLRRWSLAQGVRASTARLELPAPASAALAAPLPTPSLPMAPSWTWSAPRWLLLSHYIRYMSRQLPMYPRQSALSSLPTLARQKRCAALESRVLASRVRQAVGRRWRCDRTLARTSLQSARPSQSPARAGCRRRCSCRTGTA